MIWLDPIEIELFDGNDTHTVNMQLTTSRGTPCFLAGGLSFEEGDHDSVVEEITSTIVAEIESSGSLFEYVSNLVSDALSDYDYDQDTDPDWEE